LAATRSLEEVPSETPTRLSALDRRFGMTERGTNPRIEAGGGLSTFLTMSYIVVVNPAILAAAGMPIGAVTVMTALAAAFFTAVMGLTTNLPLALAPGMGLNAFVAFGLVLGQHLAWQTAMACIVLEGALAFALVLVGLREAIMKAVPDDLKLAIGVGIGLFIAFVGLRDGGIIVNDPATGVALGDLTTGPALITLAGLGVSLALTARGAKGAIVAGIATSTVLGLIFGILKGPSGVLQWPGSSDFSTVGDAFGHFDALTWALVPVIFALFMSDFFDTVGTATALVSRAGLMDKMGRIPRLKALLLVDSAAAGGGGVLGVSSVTTYVESGAGISEGARTGLSSLVTSGLFVLTIFFVPIISMVGQGVGKAGLHPATAPALITVGVLMITLAGKINWEDRESSIPAFFTVVGIPLTFSIAAGIGLGVLSYVVVKVAKGHARQIHPLMWLLVPMFLAYYYSTWLGVHIF